MITQVELKRLVSYDPETGEFRWKERMGKMQAGSLCGNINNRGYWTVQIFRSQYSIARLAFLYMTGSFPKGCVDHISGVKHDNSWRNLRDISSAENQKNKAAPRNNKSGFAGVRWNVDRRKWTAQIGKENRTIILGWFEEKEAAILARKKALVEHGFHENHGRAKE